jgi:hypothetical protein
VIGDTDGAGQSVHGRRLQGLRRIDPSRTAHRDQRKERESYASEKAHAASVIASHVPQGGP